MMNANRKILGVTILALIYVTPFAIAVEPVSHDHQKTKTHINQTSASEKTPDIKCKPTKIADDQGEAIGTEATKSNTDNCETKQKPKPRHNHRDMKNL